MNTTVEHAREILLHPKQEWMRIEKEPTSVGDLYRKYIAPLAAIGPVAAIIGWSVFGIGVPFAGRYRMPLGSALASGVARYVLALIGVFVLALIIDSLAPSFSGQKSRTQALKVAAYASTAAWCAGIFALVPPLAFLGILGLYSLYLLYSGLPVLMKVPQDRAAGYTLVVVICAIVLFALIAWVSAFFITVPMVHPGSMR
jgi:hypothetical protein